MMSKKDNLCPELITEDDFEMIEGHSIIYFGPEKWEGMWRNRHQLMSRFARKNKVMYVEPLYSLYRLRKQMGRGVPGILESLKCLRKKRVTKESENLYVYHSPIWVPIIGRFPLNKISWCLWNLLFRNTMRALAFSKPIIWVSRPEMSFFIKSFDEELSIYHIVDEYLSYGEKNFESRAKIEMQERELLQQVDLVIVVSNKLYETKSTLNKNTYIVPNGVDYYSYDKALTSDVPLPSDISSLPKPVIGYSGLISRRLDLDLIGQMAQKHPEWSIVLIGQINDIGCESELKCLREMMNVHFLGNKNINQVPFYVKAFDICIIPYKLNEQTENLSPLKLYDFMALGKEIVTTDVPVAREFKDVVRIADSPDNFLDCVLDALAEEDESLFSKRRQVASQNTWEDRVEKLSEIIMSQL